LIAEADAAMYEAKLAGKGLRGQLSTGGRDDVVGQFVAASAGTCL
jgi:hypothetical protein